MLLSPIFNDIILTLTFNGPLDVKKKTKDNGTMHKLYICEIQGNKF
jgi:hypothetical protein